MAAIYAAPDRSQIPEERSALLASWTTPMIILTR